MPRAILSLLSFNEVIVFKSRVYFRFLADMKILTTKCCVQWSRYSFHQCIERVVKPPAYKLFQFHFPTEVLTWHA